MVVTYLKEYGHNNFKLITLKTETKIKRNKLKKFNYLTTGETITSPEEIERISKSRTKRKIKEICLCNDFEWFVTLTIDSKLCDRFSLLDSQEKLKKLLKAYKRINKDFKYIIITEEHKKGAFHFHGMFKGCGNDLKEIKKGDFEKLPYYILDTIEKGEQIYYSKYFLDNLGWCTFMKIKNYSRCCTYISKYISKSCVKNEENQIYFCSRGLKKAQEQLMFPMNSQEMINLFGKKTFDNEFATMCDFNLDLLNQEQLKKLYYYFIDSTEYLPDNSTYVIALIKLMLIEKFKIDIDFL